VGWNSLVQDQWRVLVNTIMKFRIQCEAVYFLYMKCLLESEEGI
jgi:hypothetical protein